MSFLVLIITKFSVKHGVPPNIHSIQASIKRKKRRRDKKEICMREWEGEGPKVTWHITNTSTLPQESPPDSRPITPCRSGLHRQSGLSLHIIPMPLIYLVTLASPATHIFNTGPQPLQKVIENMGELHKSRAGRFNNVNFCF